MVIWKLHLHKCGRTQCTVPMGARTLCAKFKDNGVYVWVQCDPSAPRVTINFMVVGTGASAPPNSNYVGTVIEDDAWVWHVYEEVGNETDAK